MPKLRNMRHERFAQGLAAGKSAKQAYIDAGYKARGNSAESSAHHLSRKPKVEARVEELNRAAETDAILTRREVLETLTAIVRQERTEDAVLQRLGTIVEVRPSMSAVIAAIKQYAELERWGDRNAGNPGEVDAIAEALQEADE